MNTRSSAAALAASMKDFALAWERTQAHWNDGKAQEFAHEYIHPLPNYVARTATVIEEIDIILRKIRHDCE